MPRWTSTIARWLWPCMLFASNAVAGSAFRLPSASGPVVGVSIESDWAADGMVFVNRRGLAKQSFRENGDQEPLRWVSRFGSVSVTVVAREFASTGMNEAGLALCALDLRDSQAPRADRRQPMDGASWVQHALDVCENVDDVLALDQVVRLDESDGIPNHFFVADASGDCAVLEFLRGKLVVYRGATLPIPVLTNLRYAKALEADERGGAPWWWANPDRSAERFRGAARRIADFDGGDAMATAFSILRNELRLPTTNWNIAFELRERRLRFASARMQELKTIDLTQLDFACDAEQLMVSVDAAPTSDGGAALEPFDADADLALFRAFVTRRRVKVGEEEAEGLIRGLESFSCEP